MTSPITFCRDFPSSEQSEEMVVEEGRGEGVGGGWVGGINWTSLLGDCELETRCDINKHAVCFCGTSMFILFFFIFAVYEVLFNKNPFWNVRSN